MMFIAGPGETIFTIVRERWAWWKDQQVGFIRYGECVCFLSSDLSALLFHVIFSSDILIYEEKKGLTKTDE